MNASSLTVQSEDSSRGAMFILELSRKLEGLVYDE